MVREDYIKRMRRWQRRRQRVIRLTIEGLVWMGVAIIYYMGFSLFFDTPYEYELKHSTDRLRSEYEHLEQRYDTLMSVLDNISDRDRALFATLFESEPYNFESQYQDDNTYEALFEKSSWQLAQSIIDKSATLQRGLDNLAQTYEELQSHIDSQGDKSNYIPAIQPINNEQLTLLTASYGMRINPFYKTLVSHQGVDYTVPEGSRVFATADGVVKDVISSHATQGRTLIIDHGNGYQTQYSHLSRTNVRRGSRVRRGDIVALSGNTGLSLAPHLHYEVRYNDMRVDPIHYFFMELTPTEYQRLMRIAQSGMQSFD